MRAAIISLGSVSSKLIAKEMETYFDEVEILDIRHIEISVGTGATGILFQGTPIKEFDCVFIRGSFKYATIQRAIASLLKGKCYMPFSPDVFSIVHDKLLTHLDLERANIPMPKTYLSSSAKAAKELLKILPYPIIMKIPNGTQGKGVMFADSFAAATSILDTLDTLKQPFLIQEFIETNGEDIRVIVVGDKVVACMKRKSSSEDKRSNLHADGKGEQVIPSPEIKKVAIQTAKALGAEICGVDILEGIRKPLVIEANLSPGLQGITSVTGINVASSIAQYLYDQTSCFVEELKKKDHVTKLLSEEGIRQAEPKQKDSLQSVESKQNIITSLDFRGERVLLPKIVSKSSHFVEDVDYMIEFQEGRVEIKKL